jgi:hypothetical protein
MIVDCSPCKYRNKEETDFEWRYVLPIFGQMALENQKTWALPKIWLYSLGAGIAGCYPKCL